MYTATTDQSSTKISYREFAERKRKKKREKMENTYKNPNLLRTDFLILDVQLAHTKQHAMPLRSYFLNPYSREENDPPKK